MQTHTLKRHTKQKKHTQLGRGGRHGKTSGRGGKGQTARAGNKRRPQMRDIIKKIPKLRGYRFASPNKPMSPVNLSALDAVFTSGESVNPKVLIEKGLVLAKSGRTPRVKILAKGSLTKKLSVSDCTVSVAAKAAIEKAGGSVA